MLFALFKVQLSCALEHKCHSICQVCVCIFHIAEAFWFVRTEGETTSFCDIFWVLSVHMHIQKFNKDDNQKLDSSLPTLVKVKRPVLMPCVSVVQRLTVGHSRLIKGGAGALKQQPFPCPVPFKYEIQRQTVLAGCSHPLGRKNGYSWASGHLCL